jgi:hypothetical protein
MKRIMPGCCLHRSRDIALCGGDILLLKPRPGQALAMIVPLCIGRRSAPWEVFADDHPDAELS